MKKKGKRAKLRLKKSSSEDAAAQTAHKPPHQSIRIH